MIGPSDNYGNAAQTVKPWPVAFVGPFSVLPSPGQSPVSGEIAGWDERQGELAHRAGLEDDWRIRNAHKKAAREAFEAARRQERPWTYRGDAIDHDDWKHADGTPHHVARDRESNELALCEIADARRLSDYVEHCANLAGQNGVALPESVYVESVRRRWQRFQDSIDLANALESTGIRANYTNDKSRPRPFVVCPISRVALPLPVLRRVNFFPEQAAARRAPMLKEVEAYLARNPWARMATFTSPERVPMRNLRLAHKELTRRLSRMANEDWFKARAELVFRGVEYGTPKLCARTGEITWHVHAHTVFRPLKAFPRKWWVKFLKRVGRTMGAHWDAGRPVDNPRELVKYPCKPAYLKELLEIAGPMAVREFFEQTYKLRITETLGTLREQRGETRRYKKKRVKERNADGDFVHATRENWNRRGRAITREEERAENRRRSRLAKAKQERDNARGWCKVKETAAGSPLMLNRIVARLAPAPYASRVYEPAAYVWNFTGDFDAIASHRCMAPAIAAVRPFVELRLKLTQQEAAAGGQQRSHQSRNCPAEQVDAPLVNAPPDPLARHLEALSA